MENSRGRVSIEALKALRRDVPAGTPELMKEGWAKLTTLRGRGIKTDEERERAQCLSKGEGGGMTRSELAETQETGETVIRLIRQEKRKGDDKGRRYTPMS